MTIKLGSLFDGSGGFPLAGAMCGIEPVWAAEVEPYPIAVTRGRFPNMKHLGDVSKIDGAELEPVDLITFGSPCQDLSVAGLRKGLKHEVNGDEETTRSGLFMEAVRIIKEMREATNGQYPRFALWENVPGAFSSNKGEDFRIVCEELIKIIEPDAVMPSVPQRGWAYADSYIGDEWSLAYRVFDAQYWGVPQRRRRIHLVIDFTSRTGAREILFEREGLRGYFAEGGAPWQATPADAEGGALADDREGAAAGDRGRLDAVDFDAYNQVATGDVAKSLTSVSSDADHVPTVAYTMVVRSGCDVDANGRSAGKGALIQTERASTINTVQDQYLFQPTAFRKGTRPHNTEEAQTWEDADVAHTLNAFDMKFAQTPELVVEPVAYGIDQGATRDVGKLFLEETSKTLANGTCPGHHQGVVLAYPDTPARYIVRRLTPTECARLQGFADWWGRIEQKTELTDDELRFWLNVRNTHAAINGKAVKGYTAKQMLTWYNKLWTDGSEYKMWGNGIALPPALYCMQGTTDVLNREEDDSWMY